MMGSLQRFPDPLAGFEGSIQGIEEGRGGRGKFRVSPPTFE